MLSNRVYIDDIQDHISGKRVLLRADFNVPIDKGVIKDDKRIAETMGTIHKILDHKPKCLVIMSHLGRPDGKRVEKYSLKPVAERLEKLLGDSFAYEEQGTFDKAQNVFHWKMIPSTLKDKLFTSGTVRLEPAGEGKVKRTDSVSIEAKVFAVGGLIEQSAEKEMRAGWEKERKFLERWLAKS